MSLIVAAVLGIQGPHNSVFEVAAVHLVNRGWHTFLRGELRIARKYLRLIILLRNVLGLIH